MGAESMLVEPCKWQDFNHDRWQLIRDRYDAWWGGDLDGPLILMNLTDAHPEREPPKLPYYDHVARYGVDVPPEEIIDTRAYALSKQRYIGDAYPCAKVNPAPHENTSGCRPYSAKHEPWILLVISTLCSVDE